MSSTISATSDGRFDPRTTQTSQTTVASPVIDRSVTYEANVLAEALPPGAVAAAMAGAPRDDLLDDELALLDLGDAVRTQLTSLRTQLGSIPDRQGIIAAQVDHLTAKSIPTVVRMLREAEGWLHLSTEATTDAERDEFVTRARGMILGATAQVQSIQYRAHT